MGIRFICQACDKRLNVKGFLAGKRGVCPHCGAKVDIPWETQTARESVAASPMPAPRSVSVGQLPTGPRESQPLHGHGAINGHGYGGSALAAPTAPEPMQPMQPVQPAPVSVVPMAAPMMAVAVAIPAAPAPSSLGPADPIAEAPTAVWYVRPPSGGQYGPAAGEVMRKWIGEGRVSADSLIWREGWADWKTAASQFPEMAGPNVPRPGAAPAFSAQPALASAPSAPATIGAPSRRKNNTTLSIVVVVVLTLASLALLVALVVAIQIGAG